MQPQCQLRNSRKTGSLREGRRKIGAGTSTLLRTAQQNFRTAAYVQINSEWGKGRRRNSGKWVWVEAFQKPQVDAAENIVQHSSDF